MFLAVLENQKVERYIHEFKKRNFYPILVWNLINSSFKHSFKELKKNKIDIRTISILIKNTKSTFKNEHLFDPFCPWVYH